MVLLGVLSDETAPRRCARPPESCCSVWVRVTPPPAEVGTF